MARISRAAILLLTLLYPISAAFAFSVKDLKARFQAGVRDSVRTSYVLEGVVMSDCSSKNMAYNPNRVYNAVDTKLSECTAYVQDEDGSAGVRIIFVRPEDNVLNRYDRVKIDLRGSVIEHSQSPDCVTVSSVKSSNIVGRNNGSAEGVVVNQRRIDELSDKDIFTFVTIPDLDFACKNGSYAHICENYAQYSAIQGESRANKVNNRMDAWASLLRDTEGNVIYMPVNSLCLWRKDGRQVPQGIGRVSGIVVNEYNRRYGGNMGPYCIRPVDERDIAVARKRNSPWKCLTGWITDGTQGQSLEFEMMGVQTGVWKNGRKGDKVVNDAGPASGLFWTDSDSYVHIDNDLTNLEREKDGYESNGVILFIGPTLSWYTFDSEGKVNGTKGFYFQFSPKKASKASNLQFVFTWAAGDQDASNSWGFPAQWKVCYSMDGGNWMPLREASSGSEIFNLRCLPWWDKNIDNLGYRITPLDCGLGMQTRAFNLPIEAVEAKEITLKLSPANDRYFLPGRDAADDAVLTPDNFVTQTLNSPITKIRFGTISIDYK